MTTVTLLEPPLAVETPRGKADAMAMIDYAQMDYFYFRVALRGSGEFWDVRSDQVRLYWDESSGRGRAPSSDYEEVAASQAPEDGERWTLNHTQSREFVGGITDPPEPNEALRHASERYANEIEQLREFHRKGRWNIKESGNLLSICRGDHARKADCVWEHYAAFGAKV